MSNFGVGLFNGKPKATSFGPRKTVAFGLPLNEFAQCTTPILMLDKALGYFGCDPLYRSLFINSNGSITPCCYMVEPRFNCGEITVGSEHNDVQFNSEVHQANRKLFADIDQSEVRGYDPCSQCFLMLEGPLSPAGYVSGPVEFFTAYQYFKGGGFLF